MSMRSIDKMDDVFILLMYFIGFILVVCISAVVILVGRFLYFAFIVMWISLAGVFKDIKKSIQS